MSRGIRIGVVFFAFLCGLCLADLNQWDLSKTGGHNGKVYPDCPEERLKNNIIAGFYHGRFFYAKIDNWANYRKTLLLDPEKLFGKEEAALKVEITPTHLLPISGGRIALFFKFNDKFHVSYRNLTGILKTGKWRLHDPLKFHRTFKDAQLENKSIVWNGKNHRGDLVLTDLKGRTEKVLYQEFENDLIGQEQRIAYSNQIVERLMCGMFLRSTVGDFFSCKDSYYRGATYIWRSYLETCTFARYFHWRTPQAIDEFELLQLLPWHFTIPDEIAPDEEIDANPNSEAEKENLYLPLPPPKIAVTEETPTTTSTTVAPWLTNRKKKVIFTVCGVLGFLVITAIGFGAIYVFFLRKWLKNRKEKKEEEGKKDAEANVSIQHDQAKAETPEAKSNQTTPTVTPPVATASSTVGTVESKSGSTENSGDKK